MSLSTYTSLNSLDPYVDDLFERNPVHPEYFQTNNMNDQFRPLNAHVREQFGINSQANTPFYLCPEDKKRWSLAMNRNQHRTIQIIEDIFSGKQFQINHNNRFWDEQDEDEEDELRPPQLQREGRACTMYRCKPMYNDVIYQWRDAHPAHPDIFAKDMEEFLNGKPITFTGIYDDKEHPMEWTMKCIEYTPDTTHTEPWISLEIEEVIDGWYSSVVRPTFFGVHFTISFDLTPPLDDRLKRRVMQQEFKHEHMFQKMLHPNAFYVNMLHHHVRLRSVISQLYRSKIRLLR